MTLNLCYASIVNRPKDATVSEQCQDAASAEVVYLYVCRSDFCDLSLPLALEGLRYCS